MKLFSYLFIKDTYFELTIKYMALGTLTEDWQRAKKAHLLKDF
jgi:hypothetical protein